MVVYSHSRLQTYEQCKYRYKLRYIDKIPSPIEKSIEAHLGTCVHDALEFLYKEVLNGKIPTLDDVIEKYNSRWQEDWKESIVIVKKDFTKQDYYEKGIKFLIDYYLQHKPFDDGTLELEKKIWVELDRTFPHKIIGYIDRLVYNKKEQRYEIHDYKTANSLPNQEHFEKDRQLALYSIGIKQLYGKEVPVSLVWHYLNYNTKIISKRTTDQLEKLREDTINLIKEIENTKVFPPKKSILCDWCEYKPYCKAFGNSLPEKYRHNQSTLNLNPHDYTKPTISPYTKEHFPTASKYIRK